MPSRTKEIEKRSETIQQYFNKINITRIRDLTTPVDKRPDDSSFAFSAYRTSIENLTVIDQGRLQRYREYEQMCYVPELNGGLELYADDASLYNEDDEVVETESENQEISDNLYDMWFKSLDMNSILWHIVFNTCKYGDAFYEVIPDNYTNPKKIKYIRFIPPQFVVRREKDGNLLEFVVKITPDSRTPTSATYYSSAEASEFILKPWQMVHFKLDDKEFDPYGKSILEPGRLTFKQMKLIEDAMLIYRISRAPERRVFGIPVGNLPYREAMKRVEDIKTRYRKTPWIDPTCLSLETEIPLLNDETKTLEQLIKDFDSDKENWVYSVDRENENQIVPGKIIWAGVTRKNTQVIKITLDDGQSFKFTPDHKFILRNGEYCEAKNLKVGDSLMPLYTKETKRGYRTVYNPKNEKYYPRYMMSARFTNNEWDSNWIKRTTHHIDFNKKNDYPDNLSLNISYNEWKESLTKYEYDKIIEGITFTQIENLMGNQILARCKVAQQLNCNPGVVLDRVKKHGYSSWKDYCLTKNHKVALIEFLEEKIDTGTLTIDKYHNFAVGKQSSGILVKNSGEINYNANPLCLTLDTKIDLLDGRSEPLSTLIEEYKAGKENWVYSIDTTRDNKVVPGKIEWAGITRKNAKLVEVFVDNGKSIKCTPDHKFMLRDGNYKEAKDLLVGESLMPKYTKTSKKGYELIFNPSTRKYVPTYMMVVRETQSGLWNKKYSKKHIHHNDLRKINNSPNNLKILESVEHLRLHAIHNKENWQSNEYRSKQIASRKKAWINASDGRRQLQSEIMTEYNKSGTHKKSVIARNNKFWADVENRKKTSSKMRKPKSTTEKMHIKFDDKFWAYVDSAIKVYNLQDKMVESLNSNQEFINHFTSITPRSNKKIHRHLLTKAYRSKGFDTFAEYSSFVKNSENHKVVSVVYLDYKEDTGCITVTEWHNFMTNGITVRNSINDDFFLPRRPDGSGITIEYLPGGQQLGEIDDVRYFKEKILRTMRIPMAYLTGELTGDVARTSLSAMDVRFAKTIERIQKQIIKGLEKLSIIELAFKRFSIQDMHDFRILLTPPSKIYEIQELETLANKFNVIQTALQMADDKGNLYLPREWLYKKISKFNDQEISNIKLMQQREQAEKAEVEGTEAEAGGLGAGAGAGGLGAPGAEAGIAGPEAGMAAGPEVAGPEAVAATPPEEAPAATGGGAALTAAQIIKVAGQEFLVENEEDIKDLIKFVKQYRENEKITKDKPILKTGRKMYENNFENLFLHGELKGLIRRRNNNNKREMLKD
jgi:intein/homing endonuclease